MLLEALAELAERRTHAAPPASVLLLTMPCTSAHVFLFFFSFFLRAPFLSCCRPRRAPAARAKNQQPKKQDSVLNEAARELTTVERQYGERGTGIDACGARRAARGPAAYNYTEL